MNDLKIGEIIKNIVNLENEILELKNKRFSCFNNLIIKFKKLQLKKLEKKRMKSVEVPALLQYLETKKIKLKLAKNLATNTMIAYKCSLMRNSMAKNWGYILPYISIQECDKLLDFEFEVEIQGVKVAGIFKVDKELNLEQTAICIISNLQTLLFDNVDKILSIYDMYAYVDIIKKNENMNFQLWDDTRWFAWLLKIFVPKLLQERRSVKNINMLAEKIINLTYVENKSNFDTFIALRKDFLQYPEQLFSSDWAICFN